ncbi:Arc family DNA-binding protein [Paracoccus sp. NSM]|uniref:Arc family DNA-binding protein n=1 Tax=Paracoccus sp. NSM TaxID=3457784 RepID=UPI004036BB15
MADREPYPSEKQDRFIVRLPDGMRDRIKAAADANNRSMNAEIVAALSERFPERRTEDVFERGVQAVFEDYGWTVHFKRYLQNEGFNFSVSRGVLSILVVCQRSMADLTIDDIDRIADGCQGASKIRAVIGYGMPTRAVEAYAYQRMVILIDLLQLEDFPRDLLKLHPFRLEDGPAGKLDERWRQTYEAIHRGRDRP